MISFSSALAVLLLGCGESPGEPQATAVVAGELASPPPQLRAVRQIAPLSGSLSGSQRPRFHVTGAEIALVEVCADHACAHPLQAFLTIGGAGRPLLPLPTGVVFWRVRAPAVGPRAGFTATWELFVPPGGSAPDATRGLRYDVDADGVADAAVRDQNEEIPTDFLDVYRGRRGGLDPASVATVPLDTTHFGNPIAAAGDVNGDGFGDVAVVDGRGLVVYAGSAAGVVPAPLSITPPADPTRPFAFGFGMAAAGDVNGDGYGDVLVDDQNVHVWLYLGSPTGLGATQAWTLDRTNSGTSVRILTAADLNGDRFGDVVVDDFGPDGTPQGFRVFHGSAAGLESPDAGTLVVRPSLPFGAAGDVDGDGIADLVTTENSILVLFPGGPGFPPANPTETVPVQPTRPFIQIGDFNGDGRFDVAATTSTPTSSLFFTDDRIDVYLGSSAGISPAPQVTILESDVLPDNTLNFGASLSNGDYDADGDEDLLAAAAASFPTPVFDASIGTVFVFAGSPTGVQSTPATRLAGGPGFGRRVTSAAPEAP